MLAMLPQRLQTLLKAFGLCAPVQQTVARCDKKWVDLGSATYIAHLQSADKNPPLEADCGGDINPDQHTFRRVDVESMAKLVRDGADRFRRIIRTLHLEPLSIEALPSEPENSNTSRQRNQYHYLRRQFTELSPLDARPEWTIHTTCEMI